MKKKKVGIKEAVKAKVTGKLPKSPQKMPSATNAPNEADDTMRRMMQSNGKKSKPY